MNLIEAKQELREHGYKLLKEGSMSLEDKIANAKNFNQPEYNGYKIPTEGNPKIWKIIIDWIDFVANLSKNNYKLENDDNYYEMVVYDKSGIFASLKATVNPELYKDNKIHVKAFCNGQLFQSPVNIKNADETLEMGYKEIQNKLEELLKTGDKNIDVLVDRIENMALEYLSKVGDDFDAMLYSQVQSGIKDGNMGDDFQSEFEDGPYPKGKKLKQWIADWVDNETDMCKQDLEDEDED